MFSVITERHGVFHLTAIRASNAKRFFSSRRTVILSDQAPHSQRRRHIFNQRKTILDE